MMAVPVEDELDFVRFVDRVVVFVVVQVDRLLALFSHAREGAGERGAHPVARTEHLLRAGLRGPDAVADVGRELINLLLLVPDQSGQILHKRTE